ncbi:MAG: AI-2E family transporter [Chitinophagales bacterium]
MKNNSAINKLVTIFSILAIMCLMVIILNFTKNVFKPIVVAALGAVIMLPIKNWLQRFLKFPAIASFVSLIVVLVPVSAIAYVVARRVNVVVENIPSINKLIDNVISKINYWMGHSSIINGAQEIDLEDSIQKNSDSIFNFLSDGVTLSSSVLFMIILTLISTFFFLWYSSAIKEFILIQSSPNKRAQINGIIIQLQEMLTKYVYGLLLVSLIMGVLNSLGLWALGVEYPFLWGFLAALLCIVPYLGTTLGALLPIFYVIGSGGEFMLAVWIGLMYFGLQQLENNVITPKIVGDSIRINPLTVIIAMLIGGLVWGIIGIILSLPLVGILRIILDSYEPTKPIAVLISSDIHKDKYSLLDNYDHEVYRLKRMFKKNEE